MNLLDQADPGNIPPQGARRFPLVGSIEPRHIVLFLLALLIVLLRLHYYDWPPNRDVTQYATAAHELLHGKRLYSDVWDIKPPAIFITYAFAEKLFGYGPLALYILNLVCALAILFGVYRAGIAAEPGPAAGLWAAAFWTAISGDVQFQVHDPNTEAFMNAFAVWAFVLMLPSEAPRPYWRAVLIGALFSLGSLYKQVLLAVPMILAVAHFASSPAGEGRKRAGFQILIMMIAGLSGWTLVTIYFAVTGRFLKFYETLFGFGPAYAGDIWENLFRAFTLQPMLGDSWVVQWSLLLLILISLIVLFKLTLGKHRAWFFLLSYALGAYIAVGIPGKFYAHYFQLLIPPMAIAAGWGISVLPGEIRGPLRRLPYILAVFLLIVLFYKEQRYYRSTPEALLPGTYAELYLTTKKLGRELGSTLAPDESLYQWGEESGIYYFSRKRPPSNIITWPLISGPGAGRFTRRTLDDLNEHPPDFVVLARYVVEWSPGHPVLKWMEPRYRKIEWNDERTNHYFDLLVRRDSPLESRLGYNQEFYPVP